MSTVVDKTKMANGQPPMPADAYVKVDSVPTAVKPMVTPGSFNLPGKLPQMSQLGKVPVPVPATQPAAPPPVKTSPTSKPALRESPFLRPILDRHETVRHIFEKEPDLQPLVPELRKHIPEVCVVGMQSHGKSSVLKMLTGISLPTGSNTVTTRPLTLRLRKSDRSVYKFKADEDAYDEIITPADVSSKLRRAMEGGIRPDMMQLTVEGPDEADIDLIDLPGMHHVGDVSGLESMIMAWVDKPSAIIIIVHDGTGECGNNWVYQKAQERRRGAAYMDRTLCVLTRADIVVTEEISRGEYLRKMLTKEGEPQDDIVRASMICPPNAEMNQADGLAREEAEFDKLRDSLPGHNSLLGTNSVMHLIAIKYARAAAKEDQNLREYVDSVYGDYLRLKEVFMRTTDPVVSFGMVWSSLRCAIEDVIRARSDKPGNHFLVLQPSAKVHQICMQQVGVLESVPSVILKSDPPEDMLMLKQLLTSHAGLPYCNNLNDVERMSNFIEYQVKKHFRVDVLEPVLAGAKDQLTKAMNLALDRVRSKHAFVMLPSAMAFMQAETTGVLTRLVERIRARLEDLIEDETQGIWTTDEHSYMGFRQAPGGFVQDTYQANISSDLAGYSHWGKVLEGEKEENKGQVMEEITEYFLNICAYWKVKIHAFVDAVGKCVRREIVSIGDLIEVHQGTISPEAIMKALQENAADHARVDRVLKALEEAQGVLAQPLPPIPSS